MPDGSGPKTSPRGNAAEVLRVGETGSGAAPDFVIPFVLRVGVIGHRDPSDAEGARAMVTVALSRLMRVIDKTMRRSAGAEGGGLTTPLRIRIISSLAEGADRIAAQAALDAVESRPSWTGELAVTIPYDIDYYRAHDCKSEWSRRQFDELLDRDPSPRALQRGVPHSEDQHEQWYRDVGQHVADQCDVLLALWDGTDNNKPAGTAATVRYALGQGTPVAWIPTMRTSGGGADDATRLDNVESRLILRFKRGDPGTERYYSLAKTPVGRLRRDLVKYFAVVRRRSDFIERLRRLQDHNRYGYRVNLSVAQE